MQYDTASHNPFHTLISQTVDVNSMSSSAEGNLMAWPVKARQCENQPCGLEAAAHCVQPDSMQSPAMPA